MNSLNPGSVLFTSHFCGLIIPQIVDEGEGNVLKFFVRIKCHGRKIVSVGFPGGMSSKGSFDSGVTATAQAKKKLGVSIGPENLSLVYSANVSDSGTKSLSGFRHGKIFYLVSGLEPSSLVEEVAVESHHKTSPYIYFYFWGVIGSLYCPCLFGYHQSALIQCLKVLAARNGEENVSMADLARKNLFRFGF